MNVLLTLENRFDRTPDGRVWSAGVPDQSFLERYHDVFSTVTVLARVREMPSPPSDSQPVSAPGVTFEPIPFYQGPWQFLLRYPRITRTIRAAVRSHEAVVLRVPSVIGTIAANDLQRAGRTYGVIVVGDPHDVFAPGVVRSVLRPFLRWWFSRELAKQCRSAVACRYVTRHSLQRRYPPGPSSFSTSCSDVDLPAGAFVASPRRFVSPPRPSRLVAVGSLSQMYKAPDVVIDTIAVLRAEGLEIEMTWVGDGCHRRAMEERAERAGLDHSVRFVGQLPPGSSVHRELDRAHLFVLPSRTEGLPRAMIEAMARALPCVGSTAGGIPELLEDEDLVRPGDVPALVDKLRSVLRDADRLSRMSVRNLAKAREFREEVLQALRRSFLRQVLESTRVPLDSKGAP